jgi:tRNA (guanine37-N1)-methyltransferase
MNKKGINFYIITLFPEATKPYLSSSILGKAAKKKILNFYLIDLKKFGEGKYKKVDDKVFGGGPGMVLKVEPIFKAILSILQPSLLTKLKKGIKIKKKEWKKNNTRIIVLSTRGKKFNQNEAKRLTKYKNLIIISGRYEGIDERVAKYIADEEISIGDFVLSGGELPALIILEAVSRYIPGVLGKYESLEDIKGSYPVYTRPATFNGWKVPPILLSGNHQKIEEWRKRFDKKQ